ncbi:MAG TPA: B12-binding domain-containing radical SAM protein [Planctomycetes bacterium]|nr:B12-binding domain-containing radical SAM protein [Planctomycetota bacterium]
MRIQLIHPPVYLNVHAMTALRPSLPLGLAYIAAVLREAGHEVSLLDAVAEAPTQVTADRHLHRLGLTPEEIVERLDEGADAFGLTNMWSFSWPLVRALIEGIKERFPDKPLVCGGEHFTALPEHSIETAPIDYCVLGEGEETAVRLFAALEAGDSVDDIPGLAYAKDGEVVRTGRQARRRNLDELPWPAWDLVDIDAYNDNNLVNGVKAGKTLPILATRGCPYSCTYCASPNMWTTRYYTRDPEDVADEILRYRREYGVVNFPFQDLTAIVKKDWVVAFCNALIARDLNDITWQFPSGTRCEVIDEEVAALLYRTNGRSLAYAPESGSERTRELIKKRMKTESLYNAVRASVKHKLNITCFFVLGFPHDTKADLKKTERMVRKLGLLGVDDIAIGFFFPLPNTALYDDLIRAGRIESNSDEFLMTPIFANEARLTEDHNYSSNLTARELTFWKYRLLLNFYGLSFLSRPWKLFGVLANALRGKETRKLETFLNEKLRRKKSLAGGGVR